MQERFCGEASKTTVVCVDSYEQSILAGRFYNLGQDSEGCSFRSSIQFLMGMEQMMNDTKTPQSYTEIRAFAPMPEPQTQRAPAATCRRGALATFMVKVLVRQHASWQGTITWMEQKREQRFRSVLELMQLMNSALCA